MSANISYPKHMNTLHYSGTVNGSPPEIHEMNDVFMTYVIIQGTGVLCLVHDICYNARNWSYQSCL